MTNLEIKCAKFILWAQVIKASASIQVELYNLPRSGRSETANRPDMLNNTDVIIRSDKVITSQRLASQLSASKENVMVLVMIYDFIKPATVLFFYVGAFLNATINKTLSSPLPISLPLHYSSPTFAPIQIYRPHVTVQ